MRGMVFNTAALKMVFVNTLQFGGTRIVSLLLSPLLLTAFIVTLEPCVELISNPEELVAHVQ